MKTIRTVGRLPLLGLFLFAVVAALATCSEDETTGPGDGDSQKEERTIRDIDYVKNKYFYFNHPRPFLNDVIPPFDYFSGDYNPDRYERIDIYMSVRPEEVQTTDGVFWANAFVDTLGDGAGLANGAANIRSGAPIPPEFDRRQFRPLEQTQYDFIVDWYGPIQIIGIALTSPMENDRYLAVSYTTLKGDMVGGTYREYGITEVPPGVDPGQFSSDSDLILELLKPGGNPLPNDPNTGYTWHYMMRNFYNLGLTNIDPASLELEIRDRTQRLDTSSPTGSNIPYIQIFGLDRYNRVGEEIPDGIFDATNDVFNGAAGILQFPSLWPFAPDDSSVFYWTDGEFSFDDTLYAAQYAKSERMYTEFLTNPLIDAYQYDIVVRAVSIDSVFLHESKGKALDEAGLSAAPSSEKPSE